MSDSSAKKDGPSAESLLRSNLEQALQQREQWLSPLRAMCREMPAGPARTETKSIVRHLEAVQSAEEALRSPRVLSLMPILTSRRADDRHVALRDWLEELYRTYERRRLARRAWTYPLVLVLIVLCLLIGFCTLIVPQFKQMFAEFGLELPVPTLQLIWISDQITLHALRTLLLVAGLIALMVPVVWWWRKNALTNRCLGRLLSGTGENLRAMAVLTRSAAELLSLGASIPEALRLGGTACGHRHFEIAATEMASRIETQEGSRFMSQRLPAMLHYAIAQEMELAKRVGLLRELSRIYSDRASSRHISIVQGMPTFALLAVGFLVMYGVVALLLPLVSMITSLA